MTANLLAGARTDGLSPFGQRGVFPLALLSLLAFCGAAAGRARLYVSPGGSESNPGTRAEPLASMTAARDAIRRRKKDGGLEEPVTVVIAGGTYRLTEPLRFTPQDSGTEQTPITYRAAEGEEPVISGGMIIGGWEKNGKLWRTTVPQVAKGQLYFRQLFVGGRRAIRARTPNEFYLRTAGPLKPLGNRRKARGDPSTKKGFRFREGDLKRWDNLEDVTVELYHSWTTSLHWIDELDMKARTVRFTNRSDWPVGYWERFERYRVENYRKALDMPGEWFLDRESGTLLYWPRKEETMNETQVVAPVVHDLMVLDGRPEQGEFITHLTFRGLTFQHEDWRFEKERKVDGQAHAWKMAAAIKAYGLHHSELRSCEIAHVGTHAVWLAKGCRDNRISRCHIHDCGGGGVYIGPPGKVGYMPPNGRVATAGNVVENSFIHHTSRVLGGSIPIWVGSSARNELRHNEISDFDYTGISVGWCWSRKKKIFQQNNTVEYNHIHHNVGDILSDNGGIYVLGHSPGSVIRRNVVHHIRHYPYINWSRGIYLDGHSSAYTVEQNVAYDIMGNGANVKGHPHTVRDNIFAFCKRSGIRVRPRAPAKQVDAERHTIKRNILVQREGLMINGESHPDHYASIDRNLYWTVGEREPRFNDWSGRHLEKVPKTGEVSFEKWRMTGRDEHSLVANPNFADLQARALRLKRGSPAEKIGFRSFDHGKAGLQGPKEWTRMPESIEREPHEFAPPPPRPPREYDFEKYDDGELPAVDGKLTENENCRLRVTDRVAAGGEKSLLFRDGPAKHRWYPHWAIRFEQRGESGRVKLSFDLRNDDQTPASVDVEFRDWSGSDWHRGPMLRIKPDGRVISAGKPVARLEPGVWTHVEMAFAFGPDAPDTYTLRLTPKGEETQTLEGLPFWEEQFAVCTWFGFSSQDDEKAAYYVDNFSLNLRSENE